MNWGNLGNFLEMGGYARYVWGAYLVTLALIVAEIVLLRVRRRRSMRDARQAGGGAGS
jgi:heme exporter protein D